jgi:hypothetical protein
MRSRRSYYQRRLAGCCDARTRWRTVN